MKKLPLILSALLAIPALIIIWSFIEPYLIDTESQVGEIPNLPPAWEGQRVAQISDFQVGLWGDNTNTIRRIIARLVEARPAAVLISGDFIYHAIPNPEQEIERAVGLVEPLIESGIPTYAVLGNHDYGMRTQQTPPKEELAAQLEAALEDLGVTVLQNEAVPLSLPDAQSNSDPNALYLVGIGASLPNQSQPQAAVAQVPNASPRLVIMHNPDSFAALPANTAPLAVAGHTHGGQVRLPFTPDWSWLTFAREDTIHADGWIDEYGEPSNQLYVNRGIGMSELPIRFNCIPELTFFTLESS